MTWQVSLSPEVVKWLRKSDPQIAKRIRDALRAIGALDNPRDRGKMLTGNLAGLWRYRVSDYRIICDIRDEELIVLALDVDRRDSNYR